MDTLINQCVINKQDTSNMVTVTPKCHDDVLFLLGQDSYYTFENITHIDFDNRTYQTCFEQQMKYLQ